MVSRAARSVELTLSFSEDGVGGRDAVINDCLLVYCFLFYKWLGFTYLRDACVRDKINNKFWDFLYG